jgi:hypothetical protein
MLYVIFILLILCFVLVSGHLFLGNVPRPSEDERHHVFLMILYSTSFPHLLSINLFICSLFNDAVSITDYIA